MAALRVQTFIVSIECNISLRVRARKPSNEKNQCLKKRIRVEVMITRQVLSPNDYGKTLALTTPPFTTPEA